MNTLDFIVESWRRWRERERESSSHPSAFLGFGMELLLCLKGSPRGRESSRAGFGSPPCCVCCVWETDGLEAAAVMGLRAEVLLLWGLVSFCVITSHSGLTQHCDNGKVQTIRRNINSFQVFKWHTGYWLRFSVVWGFLQEPGPCVGGLALRISSSLMFSCQGLYSFPLTPLARLIWI